MTQTDLNNTEQKPVMVLKVGGALLQCDMGMSRLMQAAAKIIASGQPIIMVHGGGCLVDEQLKANGMITEKLDGLRVTPEAQIPVIVGALAGTSNKTLQAAAIKAGVTCLGMSLADAGMMNAKIKDPLLGLVGEVEPKDASYLEFVLAKGWMPIVSSIAISEQGEMLNVNADQAATALAKLVSGSLVLLSDVSGVLDGKGQLINSLNREQVNELTKIGVIEKGMKVKVEAALDVAESMGQAVQIASWRHAHQLIALCQGEAVGTQIQP
ncbi:acetylglutamate kinase [Shewanella pealeana]|uniref:Acetylglutamate kinase n=1 Tax=Shewanella pealeana (strain ATCC 700345 / ANG-SQ1) TaxID=398579 RepID=ARGB_SHEPA|nr:acetylglutamate kinase [Shewanella pealeana]A8GZ19.1 RecName: Full=Acetylglutamate kinase; AltName: Full=N-acetyl-L-glutamate 5-phosphotransferase; AltName: Full=NAG kinase; Short=NAGK [Shewanella pealeana ATCC 700345]ABV85556.1 acetylglutamate kinase [Shewanella pealeana ATCC 700345]